MSYLDKLLQGAEVGWMPLGEVSNVLRGKRLTRQELSQHEKYPVFHGGIEPLGFYSKSNRPADTVMIINVGASAGTVGYSPVAFWSSDGCFCIEHSEVINNKFLYYFLIGEQHFLKSKVRVAGIPTLDNFVVEKLKIPIPPLEVQKEIVRVLDTFTELTAELKAELTARKQQYEYYRDKLLNFNNLNGCGYKWLTMSELGNYKLSYGSGASAIEFDGDTRYIRITDITEDGNLTDVPMSPSNFEEKYLLKDGDILLARSGATVGKNFYFTEKFGKAIYAGYLIRVQVNREIAVPKYIYHYLNSCEYNHFIAQTKSSGSQPNINAQQYGSFKIPVPSLEEQQRIVNILDKFDILTTSISEGLPKEIELRKKQYEYYRDLLLTFPQNTIES
ncbi:type I restriction enzyme, S subunit [Chitinophaga costaii]|uniref:Type I restriction enzyme, S subunit n=1 Tax=Chitinophaga costaii TaxID=1335309 RepID=A0A1C4ATA8_9BACT|nr:restriction endonuclease subunit S [Chitinophaga costaii]PUZ26734.1 restriction endonuclease subunit S [Chitinophaga costaii]SCB97797.1 type I restriction enzyme, S subunit [Chitinophaga costaii]